MQHCPTCDADFADDLSACPECADEPGEVHRCPRCEEDYRAADACPACGALRTGVACEAHPERSAEGRCVICGRALCEECRAREHPAYLCAEHREVMVIEGWAQVYSTASEFEAQLLRENLMAEGVEAQIYSQRDSIFSVDLGELSIVRILAPVPEYARALKVIREHMDTEGEVAFACPECGEAYEPGARECTGCGAALA